ncbi:DUF3562 domain-containing protein [Paraburkholderia phenazinium]|jgi:hypothetical protein|uniref:DUF3562 domain-containing protein n=1 Tax=Paraburkholderia phenazinium TaxID=60549 RepID=A0A1G8M6E3_9BURK|nr:DUF3562 domain-containing protein [Paraburkholderia phenazinium]SDI63397.1 Protein of unknown function [Paraburkholderia phenazinium]
MAQHQPNVDEVVRTIAAETNTPTETVSKIYADTLADYKTDARVFDYMPLLVAKKVRDTLRRTANRKI